jgi:predicted enzyme related to lactoylglutathione lyase
MQILVNIDVDDLERAIAFYRDGVGLRLGRLLFDGTVAEMCGTTAAIYLTVKSAGTVTSLNASSRRDYRRHWTPVHFDLAVDDVGAAVERAIAAGAILEGQIESFNWGRQATLSDPFGHGFCLLQFSALGYDAAT